MQTQLRAYASANTQLSPAELKAALLVHAKAHAKADADGSRVLKQSFGYWGKNGKEHGCAVGCTLHSAKLLGVWTGEESSHAGYEKIGIPRVLAYLEDNIFESLPEAQAMKWPTRFLSAITPGADLSMVWPRWFLRIARDPEHGLLKFAGKNRQILDAIEGVCALFERRIAGSEPTQAEWDSAAATARAAATEATEATEAAEAAAEATARAAATAAAAEAAAEAAEAEAEAEAADWRSL